MGWRERAHGREQRGTRESWWAVTEYAVIKGCSRLLTRASAVGALAAVALVARAAVVAARAMEVVATREARAMEAAARAAGWRRGRCRWWCG